MTNEPFYHIKDFQSSSQMFSVEMINNPAIYKGHFPGFPITPGVLSIQMIVDCAGKILNKTLQVFSIKQCKFKSPIYPQQSPILSIIFNKIEIDKTNDHITCNASIKNTNNLDFLTITCILISL